jgi:prevent-host-death family protein
MTRQTTWSGNVAKPGLHAKHSGYNLVDSTKFSRTMSTVGLFDAKTHLSELVARAAAGEEVVITRHNKPVAKLVPIAKTGAARRSVASKRQAALDALQAFEPIKTRGVSLKELVSAGRA